LVDLDGEAAPFKGGHAATVFGVHAVESALGNNRVPFMADNPLHELWRRHAPPLGYPDGVVGIELPIPGTAFFPGGYGLWGAEAGRPLPEFPVGGVMVVGHDFHSESGYRESLSRGRESESQPTWRNLLALLSAAGIPPHRCFFTNFYMGLRAGRATTGPFPGATSDVFKAYCRSFFLEQFRVQRPNLVLTLGINTPHAIAPLAPRLAGWARAPGLRRLDEAGPVQSGVEFDTVPGHLTTMVALTHPSLRPASVRHRRYLGQIGHQAELAMLRDARAAIDLAAA
jgi:hypothetical protein